MLKDIIANKKLIAKLAKNDFKQKFAGSTLGVIWAFVQPVVTVLVYWIVFDKALNAGTQGTKAGIQAPFVLWLSAGIVPWFYFSEVLSAGTVVLQEYNYLVKKVVFPINVLPIVKAVSSLFVHAFFVLFTLVVYLLYGYGVSFYILQVIYYSLSMMALAVGIIYLTSSLCVFFRDMAQLVNIFLQIGVWATPIMWNFDGMVGSMPKWLAVILKLNPMYYITSGYRDAFISQTGFWTRPALTAYFWILTIIMFVLGTHVFKKLQSQFADVL
ncbi:teichoic acid transport system permease protein [Pseudobutyrivibrio sp. ACV-2]|uniref:ABC transporter permease n=1 Tax=Pseudobutyrivibrio sp. ACV-2 TaxID=1520801 RepID=UPI000896AAC9|nr:ABC transporter permease [Pseudobutyrivibrio sp. ACV-2]SEA77082.1 teichoic acid transport system permease protein [Pseudobutyrivibrio sp. ACV-2]